jgi:hypothetical protein
METHDAVVVKLAAWRSRRARSSRRDHFLESHLAAGEVPDGLHVRQRDPVGLPLGNGSLGDAEVRSERGNATLLCFKPCVQVHGASLGLPKRLSQGISKPSLFSIGLPMDADRRRRFIATFKAKPWNEDRAKFMRETGYSKGRVSQFLDPKQPFGERAAREVALKMGLDADAFESDEAAIRALSPAALELAALFDTMSRVEQARLVRLALAARDDQGQAEERDDDEEGVRGSSLFGELTELAGKAAK